MGKEDDKAIGRTAIGRVLLKCLARSPFPRSPVRPFAHRAVARSARYRASCISVLAYTNRPLYPNGEAAAHGNVPKLSLKFWLVSPKSSTTTCDLGRSGYTSNKLRTPTASLIRLKP